MSSINRLRVLVVGRGGREHALAWRLSLSPSVEHVFVAPGNGGTAHGLENVSNIDDLEINQYEELVSAAEQRHVGLVVVGPDSAIVDGIEAHFRQANIPCFAPSREAAEIEGSKAFAKDFMRKYNIPTADYRNFDTNTYEQARDYVTSVSHRIVIKADGLAAGKGVVLPETKAEALQALDDMLINNQFGSSANSIVIEEFLEGEEVSVSTFSDGQTFASLSTGQDHKRIRDGGHGPNTGGMGVYAPVPFVTAAIMDQINREILQPTFEGLRQEGRTFRGSLFTGIILTKTGPKVLEYNARFGDPETQSILPLLGADVDLAEVMLACTQGRLHEIKLGPPIGFACNVVMAADGYPGPYRMGDVISIGRLPKGCMLFHAGTKRANDQLITAGGRVLNVVGLGASLSEAVAKAYESIESISFPGMFYRKDIGSRYVPKARTEK